MSSSHPTSGQADRPTAEQLKALRSLALSRGQSFAYPATRGAASREIGRLLRATAVSADDHGFEARRLQDVGIRNATAVRMNEVVGYGRSARGRGTTTGACHDCGVRAARARSLRGSRRVSGVPWWGRGSRGASRISDVPLGDRGRVSLVERAIESVAAMDGLVAAYVADSVDRGEPAILVPREPRDAP